MLAQKVNIPWYTIQGSQKGGTSLPLLRVSRLVAIVRQTSIAMKKYLWPYIQFTYANYANYSKVG